MTRAYPIFAFLVVALAAPGCKQATQESKESWTLTESARQRISDPALEARMLKALDAAATAGTDPSRSDFHVRVGTVIDHDGAERSFVGGNSEYAAYPEAIHAETSLMNNVITAVGPEAARREVDFVAFYREGHCHPVGPCGDCRDYLRTTTRWEELLLVCGQSEDRTVHIYSFVDRVVPESDFPEVAAEAIDLPPDRLELLVQAALEARAGGVSLFATAGEHLGVAALTNTGEIYRAAGADDAAFHYRYPVGAVLQQAATYRDYFVRAIVIAGAPGETPRLTYRDRQYGYEASSFNTKRGLSRIQLILVEEPATAAPNANGVTAAVVPTDDAAASARRYRATTFEEALPGAFSTASFNPDAVDRFFEQRAQP